MQRILRSIAMATALAAALGTSADAADFCIDEGGSIFVGQAFKVPGKGKCKTWKGFLLVPGLPVAISAGTGCTTSDGSALKLHVVSSRAADFSSSYITMPLPSLTGGTNDEIVPELSSKRTHFTGLTAAPCDPKKVPVP
jgi:hypothetical protein